MTSLEETRPISRPCPCRHQRRQLLFSLPLHYLRRTEHRRFYAPFSPFPHLGAAHHHHQDAWFCSITASRTEGPSTSRAGLTLTMSHFRFIAQKIEEKHTCDGVHNRLAVRVGRHHDCLEVQLPLRLHSPDVVSRTLTRKKKEPETAPYVDTPASRSP